MAKLKHPKLRHPSRQTDLVALTDVADRVPTMPACVHGEWRPETLKVWEELWQTDLSMRFIVPQTDLPILERFLHLYDESLYAMEEYRRERFVIGPQGLKVNPAWKVFIDCVKEIGRIEAMFGFSPLHRMRLGIAIGEAVDRLDAFGKKPRGDSFRPVVVKMQEEEREAQEELAQDEDGEDLQA